MKKIYNSLIIVCFITILAGCEQSVKESLNPDSPEFVTKQFYTHLKEGKMEEAYYLLHPDSRKIISKRDFVLDGKIRYPFMYSKIVKISVEPAVIQETWTLGEVTYHNIANVPTRINLINYRRYKSKSIKLISHLGRDKEGKWRIFMMAKPTNKKK